MKVQQIGSETDFYKVTLSSTKWWTVKFLSDGAAFIVNGQGNEVRPHGDVGRRVLTAVSNFILNNCKAAETLSSRAAESELKNERNFV